MKNSKVHNLHIEEAEEKTPISYILFNLTHMGQALFPAKIECMIQGKPIIYEVDFGAPFSLMSLKVFDVVKQHFPPLEPSNVRLNFYIDHSIEVIGVTQINV